MSVKEYVLNGKLYPKILIEEISDVFEILKLQSHILGILELSSFSKIVSLKNESHVVAVLEIAKIDKFIAKLHGTKPLNCLLIYIAHFNKFYN